MKYGEIVARALAISWRHKYLWLLALLAGDAAGTGLPSLQSDHAGRVGAQNQPVGATSDQIWYWVGAHAGLAMAAAMAVVIFAIALFLIWAIASGAVIRATAEHDLERPFGLGRAWRSGVQTFRPVLLVNLVSLVLSLAIVIPVASLAGVASDAEARGNVGLEASVGLTAVGLALAAVPLAMLLSVVILLAQRAIVLDGSRPRAAFAKAFRLIRRRPARVAATWLVAATVGLAGSLAADVGIILLALPLVGIIASAYFGSGVADAVGVGLVLGPFWAAGALALMAAVGAFNSVFWTLAYRRLDVEPRPVPAGAALPA